MLGKLLKHEWNATARRYGLFYLILGAITLFAAIIHAIPINNVFFNMGEVALLVVYVISLFGIIFCSTGMAVVRFYKNMVSDEGYLTFTLPAKVEQLVFSKFLVAFVWQVVTVVLCGLSLFCVFALGHIGLGEFFDAIASVAGEFGPLFPAFFILLLFSMMYQILVFYLSIAIGQLFGSYKILASVIAYCAIGFLFEVLMLLVVLVVCGIFGFIKVGTYMSSMNGMATFYLLSTAGIILLGIIAYFVTCHLLKKKLNLN